VSYSDLLGDRRWQQKRLEVFNVVGWKCQRCGSQDNAVQLHVHHKRYINGRMPWQYPVSAFLVLCDRCHKKEHEDRRGESKEDKVLHAAESFLQDAVDCGFRFRATQNPHGYSHWFEGGEWMPDEARGELESRLYALDRETFYLVIALASKAEES
jgi:hypothetical protein